jgi:DNA-binding NarL/FixJ family response regulator
MKMTARTPFLVGILEDNMEFALYLSGIVALDPDLELLFHAETIASAKEALSRDVIPHILLVDMQLPDGLGLEIVEAALKHPSIKILVLTVLVDRNSVLAALELGAHGYLLKDAPANQIKSAIHSVLSGETILANQAAAHAVSVLRRTPDRSEHSKDTALNGRETEIICLLSKGLTYQDIARVLELSIHTVGDYIKSIYRKLGVSSRGEAIYEARIQGCISRID